MSNLPSVSNGWDRTLLNVSSWMTEPICYLSELSYRVRGPLAPGKFDFCSTVPREIGFRSLIVGGALASAYLITLAPAAILGAMAVWGVASKVSRFMGFAMQKNGYTHVRLSAPEQTVDGEITATTQNALGPSGGLSYDHGGLPHWRYRIGGLETNVRSAIPAKNPGEKPKVPNVLVFQEIYDTALAEELIRRFSKDYAHVFYQLGPNLMGSISGVLVFTDLAVESFESASFDNNTWKINQVFAKLKVKASPNDKKHCATFIGTHLIWNSEEGRMAQIAQMKKSVQDEDPNTPVIFLADFNVNFKSDNRDKGLLLDGYTPGYTGSEPTCTNGLVDQWKKGVKGVMSGEYVDNILMKEGTGKCEAWLVRSFDETLNTNSALSDHNGVAGKITLRQKNI